jgi:hypothetical protein
VSTHAVVPTDEGRHPNGPEQLWQESWYADFVTEDEALAGYVRLGFYPNLGASWWTATVVTPEGPLTAATSYDLPAPASGLAVDDAPWSVSIDPAEYLRRFNVRAKTPAVLHADPAGPYLGSPGEPTSLGIDLTWTTEGFPYHYEMTTRYELPCLVAGELTLGDRRVVVQGQGQRDHSWGVRDWWSMSWCWSAARLDDGMRVHCTEIRVPGAPGFGYVQHPERGSMEPVTAVRVSEELGRHGMPTSAELTAEPGGLHLAIEPVAFAPLLLTAPDGRLSRFPRAFARFAADDGRRGTGWIEWNQPQDADKS